jgi:hypothetical protein
MRNILIFSCLIALFTPAVLHAQGVVNEQLENWDLEQVARDVLSEDAADLKRPVSIEHQIVTHSIRSTVRPTDTFTGDSVEELTLTAGWQHSSIIDNSALKNVLKENLRAYAGKDKELCVSVPGAVPTRFGIKENSIKAVLKRLGVSAKDVRPQFNFSVAESLPSFDIYMLGASMARTIFDKLFACQDVTLRLSPRPTLDDVQLSVSTVAGETVSIPVAINGAAQLVKVADDAEWIIEPGGERFPFKHDSTAHKSLAAQVQKEGKVKFSISKLQIERNFWDSSFAERSIDIHLVGADQLWLGSMSTSVLEGIRVRIGKGYVLSQISPQCRKLAQASGDIELKHFEYCDLQIEPVVRGRSLELGPMSREAWARTTEFLVVDPEESDVIYGYDEPVETCADISPAGSGARQGSSRSTGSSKAAPKSEEDSLKDLMNDYEDN